MGILRKLRPKAAPEVAMIGSFHDFTSISEYRKIFESRGIKVINPPSDTPIDIAEEFVRFPGDDMEVPDYEIQDKVFDAILDPVGIGRRAVYVVLGERLHVGRALSYELGSLTNRHLLKRAFKDPKGHELPIYFDHTPSPGEVFIDWFARNRVVDPHELSDLLISNRLTPLSDSTGER